MCLKFPVLVTITALSHFTSSITGQYIPAAVAGLLVFYSAGYISTGGLPGHCINNHEKLEDFTIEQAGAELCQALFQL